MPSPVGTLPTSPSLLEAAHAFGRPGCALRPGCSWVASAAAGPHGPHTHASVHNEPSVRNAQTLFTPQLTRKSKADDGQEGRTPHSKWLLCCSTRHQVDAHQLVLPAHSKGVWMCHKQALECNAQSPAGTIRVVVQKRQQRLQLEDAGRWRGGCWCACGCGRGCV